MANIPETRISLVLRLRDSADAGAWREFAAIYQPVVYRMILKRGFQQADAAEISQELLIKVANAINQWDPDQSKGSFRGWLFRIARNQMVDFLKRSQRNAAISGGSELLQLVKESADPRSVPPANPLSPTRDSSDFDWECRRQIYQVAAGYVRQQVTDRTWHAFERTAVDGEQISAVALDLGMSVAAVYVARSRVMKQLQTYVRRYLNRDSGFVVQSAEASSKSNVPEDQS